MGCGKEPGLNLMEVGDQEVFQTKLENGREVAQESVFPTLLFF